jgi:hypothetical protein
MIRILAENESLEITKLYGVKLIIVLYIFIQCVILNS